VAYRVDDLTAALAHLKAEGVPLIDELPRPGSRGAKVAFVHPKGMGGVLVELVQEG
jgi:methylmalonyl-CoA/ethylmalonyl-CoA epimerase